MHAKMGVWDPKWRGISRRSQHPRCRYLRDEDGQVVGRVVMHHSPRTGKRHRAEVLTRTGFQHVGVDTPVLEEAFAFIEQVTRVSAMPNDDVADLGAQTSLPGVRS